MDRPLDQLILSEIQKAGCAAVLHICKDRLDMERYRSYNSCCDVVNWGVYEALIPSRRAGPCSRTNR